MRPIWKRTELNAPAAQMLPATFSAAPGKYLFLLLFVFLLGGGRELKKNCQVHSLSGSSVEGKPKKNCPAHLWLTPANPNPKHPKRVPNPHKSRDSPNGNQWEAHPGAQPLALRWLPRKVHTWSLHGSLRIGVMTPNLFDRFSGKISVQKSSNQFVGEAWAQVT